MRQVEISADEHALIIACITGTVRRIQQSAPERDAIRYTTAAAECISRLNTGAIDQTDCEFINTAIQKTVDLLRKDQNVSGSQFAAVRSMGDVIRNKLRLIQ